MAVRARIAFGFSLLSAPAAALDWGENDLYVRFVDVGPGLCAVAIIPGGHTMVYDVGHWDGRNCATAVGELVPQDREIDLLIISHSDADHLGDADDILADYSVKQVVHTGHPGTSQEWEGANEAITTEGEDGATVLSLGDATIEPGTQWELGPAKVTFVAGWHEWTETDLDGPESRNVISIVARLEFAGQSILLTGDAIGRRRTDPNSACKDAEKKMVDNAAAVPLRAAVMTAPHHGGNNGSSNCFIEAVDPDYVIFSAGNKHHHPTQGAADRYIASGVPLEHLFRTDLGDNEGKPEWIFGALKGCKDKAGDDDVDVVISAAGKVSVGYRVPKSGC
jgi:competence protein ComEC